MLVTDKDDGDNDDDDVTMLMMMTMMKVVTERVLKCDVIKN